MNELPVYSFGTYYKRGNRHQVPQSAGIRSIVYHFKQKFGPSSDWFDVDFGDGVRCTGRTYEQASLGIRNVALRRTAVIRNAVGIAAVRPQQVSLVPLPSSNALEGVPHAGGGGRVAEVLADAGFGVVADGLRWARNQSPASESDHGARTSAGQRYIDLVWDGRGLFQDVVLVDDVVTYGDTGAAAAERIFRENESVVRGLITIGRTNGGLFPDAATSRVSLITYDDDPREPNWCAHLDGKSAQLYPRPR